MSRRVSARVARPDPRRADCSDRPPVLSLCSLGSLQTETRVVEVHHPQLACFRVSPEDFTRGEKHAVLLHNGFQPRTADPHDTSGAPGWWCRRRRQLEGSGGAPARRPGVLSTLRNVCNTLMSCTPTTVIYIHLVCAGSCTVLRVMLRSIHVLVESTCWM